MHCTFREYKYEVMVGSPIHNSDMDDQDIIPLLQGVNNVERDMRGLIEGLDSFSLKKAVSNQKLEKVTEAPEEKAARDELENSWLMSHFICFVLNTLACAFLKVGSVTYNLPLLQLRRSTVKFRMQVDRSILPFLSSVYLSLCSASVSCFSFCLCI